MKHLSLMLKCAIKHVSAADYRLLTRFATATQEVSLEDAHFGSGMEADEVERLASSL